MTPNRIDPGGAGWAPRSLARFAVIVAVIAVGGCSTVVTGSAIKSGGPAPASANAALLDPGNYPRLPRPPLGNEIGRASCWVRVYI